VEPAQLFVHPKYKTADDSQPGMLSYSSKKLKMCKEFGPYFVCFTDMSENPNVDTTWPEIWDI
jgi:hypothetical protein